MMGAWLTPYKHGLTLYVLERQIWSSRSNGTSVRNYRDPPEKMTLKVIGTDTDQSTTYDFLLVIYNNYGPISYLFRQNGDLNGKSQNFPTPMYLVLPLTWFQTVEIVRRKCIHRDTIPECDRQTDRQTDRQINCTTIS